MADEIEQEILLPEPSSSSESDAEEWNPANANGTTSMQI